MALPADFSKIYGSTATGGLTPISNVNYAKGWEFVGSNPPTKNDFSYLQNLSDLKSQWLYSNKLQRANPFGDIKSDGTVPTALANLGLPAMLAEKAPLNNPGLTGSVTITSTAPFIRLVESDTGKEYFIVVDNGNIRLNQDNTSGVNGILSFDSTTKNWTLPCGIIPNNYDNFNSLFQKINTSSLGANGWFKDTKTGLVIQYGIGGGSGGSGVQKYPIQFPIAFPVRCVNLQATLISSDWDANSGSTLGVIINNTQATCWSSHSFYWFAIGY